MKCSRIQAWISEEMDDLLPPERVAPLAEHLQKCAECREYRSDLRDGARMLQATAPTLPDDFDWNLQLKLSRAMREAAKESHPWQAAPSRWQPWLSRVGVSAAVGLAAVLTLAMVLPGDLFSDGPAGNLATGDPALRLPVQGAASLELTDATRRPLEVDFGGASPYGRGLQRRVSSQDAFTNGVMSRVGSLEVQRIRQLEQDNEILRRRLFGQDRQIQYLKAQLDSLLGPAVDRK